jgi:hypothetical protein
MAVQVLEKLFVVQNKHRAGGLEMADLLFLKLKRVYIYE